MLCRFQNSVALSTNFAFILFAVECLTLPGQCNPSRTFAYQTPPISRKANIWGNIIRLVVDLHVGQVSESNSLMAVSERQMSGKGCTVREGLSTLVLILLLYSFMRYFCTLTNFLMEFIFVYMYKFC